MSVDSWLPALGRAIVWPAAPSEMSYSVLSDLEACPRRWALEHATYSDVWTGRGYPPPASLSAMAGRVVHRALELLLKASASVPDSLVGATALVFALRELDGLSVLLRRVVDQVVESYQGNPRASATLDRTRDDLIARIPKLRAQTQAHIARLAPNLPVRQGSHASTGGLGTGALGDGSFPEMLIQSSVLGWKGIVDLLTISGEQVEIVDFKTGSHSPLHAEQLMVYAVLWKDDQRRNPTARDATQLRVSYSGDEVVLDGPPIDVLDGLRDDLRRRTDAALELTVGREPLARPTADNCEWCSVRHLCEDYWATFGPIVTRQLSDYLLSDLELVVKSRNGPRSYVAAPASPAGPAPEVLLRVQDGVDLEVGARLRITGAVFDEPEDGMPTATMTRFTESYPVTSESEDGPA